MVFSAGDLRRAHAEVGHTEHVIAQRRVLYSTVLDIVTDADTAIDHPVDLLDSPALRGNLGEVLNGTGGYRPDVCVPLDALAAPGFTTAVAGLPGPVGFVTVRGRGAGGGAAPRERRAPPPW